MTEATISRRSVYILAAAGLILGPVPLMLWLGRWKLALLYFFTSLAMVALYFALPMLGVIDPIVINGFDPSTFLSLITFPIAAVGLFHALKINHGQDAPPWYTKWYFAFTLPLALPLAIAFLIRTFLYQPFNSPSESNVPSLVVGDYFFVSKRAYGNGDTPQRGDIAVFKLPSNPSIDYVKRVVGLPGDRLQMIGGVLHINGVPVKLEPVDLGAEFKTQADMKFFRETLPGGRSYVIADLGESEADNTQEYIVPAGHYFTMGDNRDNSQDSRYLDAIGYIPLENFVGSYAFRFWNSRGLALTNRPTEMPAQP